jgi:transposase
MTLVSASVCVDSVLGIDVAKAKADICFERVQPSAKPIHRCYENSPAGHQRLLAWLATQAVGQVHVCLEATGSYSDALALCEALKRATASASSTRCASNVMAKANCAASKPTRAMPP